MAEHEYQRLTRAKQRAAFAVISTVRSSLWLGKDHLLRIDTTGYTESYKRFYFRDIQAIIIRKTDRGRILNLVLGVLAGICALFGGLGTGAEMHWIFGSLTAFFLLPLIINTAAGPTSTCHVRTAVQTEELPLTRLRRARRALARLRPFITKAQGTLAPAEVPAELREAAPPTAAAAEGSEGISQPVPEDPNLPPRMTP